MTENEPNRPPSMEELGKRLERGREAAGLTPAAKADTPSAAMGEGLRVSVEFVVSVIVGAVLGYGIGDWAGNKAIGLVLGMIIGFLAGLRAIHRLLMSNVEDAKEKDTAEDGRDDE